MFVCLPVSFQVCHIVLGLRPATPEEEGQIIRYSYLKLFSGYTPPPPGDFSLALQRMPALEQEVRWGDCRHFPPTLHFYCANVSLQRAVCY